MKRGADIHLRDRLGLNALNDALTSVNPDIAKYLISQGADVHNISYNGVTVARSIELRLGRVNSGTELHKELSDIRDMMIARGVEFPAKHPKEVKKWMRSQGMHVIGDD